MRILVFPTTQGVDALFTESMDDDRNPELGTKYDEPEAAVLLVACAIGLATGSVQTPSQPRLLTVALIPTLFSCAMLLLQLDTNFTNIDHCLLNDAEAVVMAAGAGVVVFNEVIHTLRDFIWPSTPVNNTNWVYWARDLPLSERWVTLLLPPASGGLAVGLLRYVSRGFDNPPPDEQPQQQQQGQTPAPSDGLSAKSVTPLTQQHAPNTNSQAPPATASRGSEHSKAVLSNTTTSSSDHDSDSDSSDRVNSNQDASTSGSFTVWSLPWVTSGSQGLQERLLRVARPVLKAGAAAITLGTGNSLGPEGPSVEIGRAAARSLGTVLKSKQRRLLSLVAAGSGAGETHILGLLLNTPMCID